MHAADDVFLDTTPFHTAVGERVRWEPFAGSDVPFLACRDLAVFKGFFDRTKDWADLEEMAAAGTLDVEAVAVAMPAVGEQRSAAVPTAQPSVRPSGCCTPFTAPGSPLTKSFAT